MTTLSLTTSRIINAPIETVFNAWLDPATLSKFMIPGDGMTVPSADADGKEGGRFSIVMRAGDQDIPHAGTYLTIERYSKIVFTWESPFSVDGSTVTLNLSSNDTGATEIELVHEKFPDETSRDNHHSGWDNILSALAGVVE
jgi:uncharacterized protein YndB with AHSA1/START domain